MDLKRRTASAGMEEQMVQVEVEILVQEYDTIQGGEPRGAYQGSLESHLVAPVSRERLAAGLLAAQGSVVADTDCTADTADTVAVVEIGEGEVHVAR